MAKKTIKAQMKQRRDTKANWAATNPVLLDGELGIVSDDPNLYKVGDGATAWNDLPFRGFDGTLAQELGTSPNAAISQKAVTKKCNQLASEINKLDNHFYNISDFTDNLMIDESGEIVDNAYFRVLTGIGVSTGDRIIMKGIVSDNNVACCVAAYDRNGNFILDKSIFKSLADDKEFVVTEGVVQVALCTLLRITDISVQVVRSMSLSEMHRDITELSQGTLKLTTEDFNQDDIFIEAGGKEISNSAYITTDYILIKGIKELQVRAAMGNAYGGGITFYDKGQRYISQLYGVADVEIIDYTVNSSDIPNNAWYCKVQGRKEKDDLYVKYKIAPNAISESIISYCTLPTYIKPIYEASTDRFTVQNPLVISDTPHIRTSYVVQAFSKMGTLGRLTVTKGTKAYAAGIIDIDANNLYEYNPNNPTAYNTYEHGLTLSEFIRITIIVGATPMTAEITGKAKVIIETAKGRYEKEIMWNAGSGEVAFYTTAEMKEAHVTLSIKGKNIWYFGDSYLDFWTPYAYNLGANNILIDGYSGRNSMQAFLSLKRELLTNTPKTIIWGMGMNDGDAADSVNADWHYYYKQLVKLCKQYQINLVFVTIPNTPIVNNYYKNQIIRTSGYRYLDISKLMGADEIGSTWYTGLLSGDEVHPTSQGAKIIATHIISQFAEIMS